MIQSLVWGLAAFNLVCVGTETGSGGIAGGGDYSIVYRVDLDQGLWCEEGCDPLRDVVRVEGDLLVLEERDYRTRPRAVATVTIHTAVDLSTGRHHSFVGRTTTVVPVGTRREGRCERSAFTGFLRSRVTRDP